MASGGQPGGNDDVLQVVGTEGIAASGWQVLHAAAYTAAFAAVFRAGGAGTGERHRHPRSSRRSAGVGRRPRPPAPQSQLVSERDRTLRVRPGTAARLAGADVQSDPAAPPRHRSVLGQALTDDARTPRGRAPLARSNRVRAALADAAPRRAVRSRLSVAARDGASDRSLSLLGPRMGRRLVSRRRDFVGARADGPARPRGRRSMPDVGATPAAARCPVHRLRRAAARRLPSFRSIRGPCLFRPA